MIRLAHSDDLQMMQDIERAAGETFRQLGMDQIADDEPFPVETLGAYAAAGRAWVYVDGLDYPVAYLLADVVDGNGHVEQVSVHPDYAHQGIGHELLHAARIWTRGHGMQRQTLSTFRDVCPGTLRTIGALVSKCSTPAAGVQNSLTSWNTRHSWG
ncbi:GNAT family N-acetyltransferase [Paenarthrobacter nicotinovorans]|uniref:GNAT family N-acetyltransferase n=1 Tax=Paenarthrobacter nicotinovorans TaxID=29320 RepID=UPI0039A45BEF